MSGERRTHAGRSGGRTRAFKRARLAELALDADKALADVMGTSIALHWTQSRRWEWLMFNTTGGDPETTAVTDWELERYFELV
jgi:glutamine synthetase